MKTKNSSSDIKSYLTFVAKLHTAHEEGLTTTHRRYKSKDCHPGGTVLDRWLYTRESPYENSRFTG